MDAEVEDDVDEGCVWKMWKRKEKDGGVEGVYIGLDASKVGPSEGFLPVVRRD